MTLSTFVPLAALGFVVGMVSGFSGVGGGAFLVPALVRIAGLSWAAANGLSLTQMIFTSMSGAVQRYRKGEVHVQLAIWTLVGSIPGSYLGRRIVKMLEGGGHVVIAGREIDLINLVLTLFFSASVMIMAIRMIRGGRPKGGSPSNGSVVIKPPLAILLGLAVGVTSAMLGIGGGFLFVPVAIQMGMPVALAVGTSLFQMPITAATGALLYSGTDNIPYLWLVPLLGGSLSGVWCGISLSRRFNNERYRVVLGYTLFAISLVVLATITMRSH